MAQIWFVVVFMRSQQGAIMDSRAYLRYLQQKIYESNEGLDLNLNIVDPQSEEVKERIERARDVWGHSDSPLDLSVLERIATEPPWARLNFLAESLYQSAIKLVSDKDRKILEDKDIAVGFLPTRILNACCIGSPSKGCVIAINYAIYFTSWLLSIALTAPHLTGELLEDALESVYPEDILAASVKATLSPTFENLAELGRHYSYMSSELLSIGSGGQILTIQFILLHEVGHICNGDLDRGSAYAVLDLDNREIDYITPSHRREFAADQFALKASVSNATDPVGAWAIFSQVEAFFQFLMYVERAGKLTDNRTHPSAISRLFQLRQTMYTRWGEDEAGYMKMISSQFEHMGRDLLKDY